MSPQKCRTESGTDVRPTSTPTSAGYWYWMDWKANLSIISGLPTNRALPCSRLKSNYDAGHFWGGAYSPDFGKPGVGRGPSLLVQRSRALLLDAQVAQKTA